MMLVLLRLSSWSDKVKETVLMSLGTKQDSEGG